MKKFIISEEEKNRILGLHSNVVLETKKEKIIFKSDYFEDVFNNLKKRFDLTLNQVDEVMVYYRDDIEMGFHNGYSVKSVVDSWVKDGKLKWKR
jgi:hypothetical protein